MRQEIENLIIKKPEYIKALSLYSEVLEEIFNDLNNRFYDLMNADFNTDSIVLKNKGSL